MKRVDPETYYQIYRPKLSRRQQIAMSAFTDLNRERDYISTQMGAIPSNIKKTAITNYWEQLTAPLALSYFILFIQSLDDVFTQYTMEQAKAKLDG